MKTHFSRGLIALTIAVALCTMQAARADWNPGDGHKMHFPQLPDPTGWDVNMTYPKVLADDWLCTETGAVNDVHFWFSIEHDDPIVFNALLAAGIVHTSIHADIPATPTSYSRPGELLWTRDFPVGSGPGTAFPRPWGTGQQGWYDPNTGEARPNDHFQIFQMNIGDILNPFTQVEGTIYWLDLSIILPGTTLQNRIGWKTSLQHFNDDAVWGDFPDPVLWRELRDPFTQHSLDLAFVITPEPASMLVLLCGLGAAMLRRTRW